MPKEILVKIVRDRIPEHLAGSEIEYKKISDPKIARNELRKKLAEEVAEYLIEPGIEELADVVSVCHALALRDLGVRWSVVLERIDDKNMRKGSMLDSMGMFVQSLTVEEFDAKDRK